MIRNGARAQRRGGRGTGEGRQGRRRQTRPAVMALEDRRLMATFLVTNTADSGPGSLRAEIDLANANPGANTIEFDSTNAFQTAQTITLTSGQLELSNTSGTQTILGPPAGVTVSGGGLSRVFQVDEQVTASISGLTITEGGVTSPGGGLTNDGTLTLTNCSISGNTASSGGGVYTGQYGTTTLNNCTISDNSALRNGGGLYDFLGTTTLNNCTVSGNSALGNRGGLYDFVGATTMSDVVVQGNLAASGGGLAIFFGTTSFTNCSFSGDVASVSGGGLYNKGGTTTLTGCTISGERAAVNGGGLYNNDYGSTTLTNCTVSDNSASLNGGGLANSSGTTTLSDCTVSGNSSGHGGGVCNLKGTTTLDNAEIRANSANDGGGLATYGGTTTLSDCTVSGNTAAGEAGGVLDNSGTTNLLNSTVSGNTAASSGGVGTDHYGTTTMTDCTVSGNAASGNAGGVGTDNSSTTMTDCTVSGNSSVSGGGLYTDNNGAATLTNCTVSGNAARDNGGGLYNTSGGMTTLTDDTVSANSAGISGGGLDNLDGTVTIGNTILAKNTAATSGPDALGTVDSLGTNLVGETDGSSGWVASDLTGTSAQPLNPLLAPLGNYGGPTQTMALLPGSPAIDAGNNALIPVGVTTDQRGLPRIVNGVVDIGASESSQFTIAVTSGSNQSTGIFTGFPAPLVATVTANNPLEPVAGGLVTFTPPQSGASAILTGSPATISANGEASVTATANGTVGSYIVSAGARGISNTADFNLTNQAIPIITTTPSVTSVTLATSPVILKDAAVLSNGYSETGTVTFTLYLGTTLVDTETVSVSGNGSYTTPTGYTLPTTGTVTGTYQWDASYGGDTFNTPASENNASIEQVTVSPASPTLVTAAGAAITLSNATPPTLNDSAAVAGGYGPTGTITFTLNAPAALGGAVVYTDQVTVNGNGTYTTSQGEHPGGYVLPSSGTVTGSYTWHASYGGDSNNDTANDQGGTAEEQTVSPASPSLATTPSPSSGTLGSTSITISGTKYLDPTGNGFTSADTPQSGVTIDLYQQVGGSETLVATTTTARNGTYSFSVSPGTYNVQESVPSGYVQTGGGPNGSTGNTYYTVVATSGHSYSGYDFADYLIPTCTPTNVCYKVTTPSNCSTTVTNLAGNTQQGDTVTVTFTVPSGMNDQLTLVSYLAPGPSFSDSTAYQQVIYQQATGTFTPGPHSLTIRLPNSYYQIDFICGAALTQLEPIENGNAYGPDSAEILYHAQDRYISGDNGGTTVPNPMPTPSPGPTPSSPTTTTPTSTSTLTDTAVLSGGYHETGTITFTLVAPGGSPVDTETVTVNGDGTYTTPRGYTLSPSSATGTYQWVVVYNGDPNNNGVTSLLGSEPVSVQAASLTIATTPGGSVTIGCGTNLTDSATLSGGNNPTGTITFYLFAPGVTPNGADSNNVYSDSVTVAGDGTYTTSMGNNPGGSAPTAAGTYQWVAVYSGDSENAGVTSPFGSEPESAAASPVGAGQFATIGFWHNQNGQAVIDSFNGGSTQRRLGNWLASNFPNLFGTSNPYTDTSLAGLTNAQIAQVYTNLWTPNGVTKNTYVQAFAVALGIYADTTSLGGDATAQRYGFSITAAGGGPATFNVGSNGAAFGVANNTNLSVTTVLQILNNKFSASTGNFYGGNQASTSAANNVVNGINTAGDLTNTVALSAPAGTNAYTPAQIRAAYGISSLSEDGTGQTIAIVDAYDDPSIDQAVDAFDLQFGLTASGPSLAAQYGPASASLTIVNQSGQTSALPGTDPSGPGTDNWEVEEALDVEWIHAIAPGAQIILVEANSQSLSDLMSAAATAASLPGVSVVSMSWGFPEGQSVFADDEANYDSVFNVPGVTFVASTGDYGVADPEYPAFSPNVVAVGGTSLNLNADNSYNSETGWGYDSDSVGMSIGSGGGISLYESEPSYQQGVQSTGMRTTPDISMVADPATGAWIADTYNLDPTNPFEVVGGTSLSAPAFAGLIALVNQERVAVGSAVLNSTSPTEIQQALYSLPQADYNIITSGSNGYTANAGYNLVTGLGTPVANLLVPDLAAYNGPTTSYAGAKVGPLQDATLSGTWSTGSDPNNVFGVWNAILVSSSGLGSGPQPGAAGTFHTPMGGTLAQDVTASRSVATLVRTLGTTLGLPPSSLSQGGSLQALGAATNPRPLGQTAHAPATVTTTPDATGLGPHEAARWIAHSALSFPVDFASPSGSPAPRLNVLDRFIPSRDRTDLVTDAVLEELTADVVLEPAEQGNGTMTLPVLPTNRVTRDPVIAVPLPRADRQESPADAAAGLAILGLVAGTWAGATGLGDARKRRSGHPFSRRKSP